MDKVMKIRLETIIKDYRSKRSRKRITDKDTYELALRDIWATSVYALYYLRNNKTNSSAYKEKINKLKKYGVL